MKFSVSNVIVAVMLLALGWAFGSKDREPQVVTVRDTVAYRIYAHRLDQARIETEGLRARLEDVEARPPRVVTHTDTLVMPPDTVIRFVGVDSRGSLSIDMLISVPDSNKVERAPEYHAGIDISDCDDGYAIQDGTVVCDRARLGHLYLGINVGSETWGGAWWEPSYRSPWNAYAGHTGTEWVFGLRRGWRVF